MKKKKYEYRKDGMLHRTNGPACILITSRGTTLWCLFNNPHRYYGPCHGELLWYFHGAQLK